MIVTVESLLFLIVVLLGLLLYKALVRSRWFSSFVGGIVSAPSEGREALTRLDFDRESAAIAAEEAARRAEEQARLKHDLECASRKTPAAKKARTARKPKNS
jgi:hypothetical protein